MILPNSRTINGNGSVCQDDENVLFQIEPILNANEYLWILPNGVQGNSSTNEILLNFGSDAQSGEIIVRGINDCGDGESSSLYIEIYQKPETPQIYFDGESLISNALEGNQWYNENGEIENENNQSLFVNEDGYYFCIVSINGCLSDTSNIEHVVLMKNSSLKSETKISVFPNPTSDNIRVQTTSNTEQINKIEIINNQAQIIYSLNPESNDEIIAINDLPAGLYILRIGLETEIHNIRISKF